LAEPDGILHSAFSLLHSPGDVALMSHWWSFRGFFILHSTFCIPFTMWLWGGFVRFQPFEVRCSMFNVQPLSERILAFSL